MNDILQLKGNFEQRENSNRPGPATLLAHQCVKVDHLQSLISDLNQLQIFWENNNLLRKTLISVYYTRVVPKSNRISRLLKSDVIPNESIVGAKFKTTNKQHKHVITHYVPVSSLKTTIQDLKKAIRILNEFFNGKIDTDTFNDKTNLTKIDFSKYTYDGQTFPKTAFEQVIVDASFVESFGLNEPTDNVENQSLVTFYDTQTNLLELLKKLGIAATPNQKLNSTTVLLDEINLKILYEKAPYLVSMATEDLSKLDPYYFEESLNNQGVLTIDEPKNEPTIGVIDTQFDKNVYFSKWVESTSLIDPNIPMETSDYTHGTNVVSLIVDGPTLNPALDDGLGRFKVRHYGVALARGFSSFSIIKAIQQIVLENPSIHVWNLSLGSDKEINDNFISAEASELDKIQFENDVIFIIAGTNKVNSLSSQRIGAPADSLNSIVVNSVDSQNQPAKYTRKGIVLSFFAKPDVSYYGGTPGDYMYVVDPLGMGKVTGTSFAAPWIARKVAYLIEVLGLSKELAKALIIDSAIGWKEGVDNASIALKGYGVVPQKIDDIVKSDEDEIKFLVSGVSEKYDTYNYNFPVPLVDDKYPYVAKATLVYFPKTSRNQGVDYTNTELDIKFGRINNDNKIKDIKGNNQTDSNGFVLEDDARNLFRKWDNVKHIGETLKPGTRARLSYNNPNWGMSIKTKERLNHNDGENIRFGVVITLKEITGKNRIEDFIQQASFRGWLVTHLSVENQVDVYNQADETINFD